MYIKTLELKDYRNYNTLFMDFHDRINILYGDNAQGKTNILESIYVCATTKSHKGSKDREIIKMDKEESHIRLHVERDGVIHKIDMHLKKNKPKGVAINGIPIKKTSELFGIVNIVFFSPEDLSIIKNGPAERRRFIDLELCQIDKVYLYNLANYNKIITQRNNLLKQISFNRKLLDTLSIWDMQLVEYGTKIMERRDSFISQLNEIVYEIHKKLSGNKEHLRIQYEPNVAVKDFKSKLENTLERDIATKMTNYGPHRDDISFFNGSQDLRKFGSQGQQRTSALSLKLAEIELVKIVTKDKPILLLDDVLSELDRNRQTHLLNSIHDIQTIITCTGLEEFIANRMEFDKTYRVVEGTVTDENTLSLDFIHRKTGGNL
ncbi:DNA replication and repair protein RecF [Anaerocolumna cellulosilytica]|uniref:DNA replication and repair protein RecF n=1 Tax=Anaerocolumna cellulosilytica TaxID=433286 RepID=A0A6S6QY45_9FIRM|nr:DNA replication/repair protein RecF [Anaerocolumna cellulosilytica]MBB5195951.1 DNA replication and repair protein RecF [Anaerocolumna cellulosilytica]BCJ92435.1 DNA replication and repair protein RecF [Anaerocolumna cellulosilytica]